MAQLAPEPELQVSELPSSTEKGSIRIQHGVQRCGDAVALQAHSLGVPRQEGALPYDPARAADVPTGREPRDAGHRGGLTSPTAA